MEQHLCPLFIVGAGRSGTKFLRNVLNKSESIYLVDEVHYFSWLIHDGVRKKLRRICKNRSDYTLDRVIEILLHTEHFGTYWKRDNRFNEDMVREWFRSRAIDDKNIYSFILNRNYEARRRLRKNLRYLGEKGGANVFSLGRLRQWYPNAKFLFIYRDPIAVLHSEVNKDRKPDYPIKKSNAMYPYGLVLYVFFVWLLAAVIAIRSRKGYSGSFHIIQYEAMTSDLENTTRAICERLGIPFDPSLTVVRKVDSSFASVDRERLWLAPWWVRCVYQIFLSHVRKVLDQYALTSRPGLKEAELIRTGEEDPVGDVDSPPLATGQDK